MEKKNLAFGRMNYILLAVGLLVVVAGFLLMSGGETTAERYDPSIFSAVHVKVAPVVTFVGFVSIIAAILWKPKDQ